MILFCRTIVLVFTCSTKQRGKMNTNPAQLQAEAEAHIESQFQDLLDELYPVYEIAGVTIYPSRILKECDPVAYRIALSEYEDEVAERSQGL